MRKKKSADKGRHIFTLFFSIYFRELLGFDSCLGVMECFAIAIKWPTKRFENVEEAVQMSAGRFR